MFVLTTQRVIHEVPFKNETGIVTIRFRSFEGDERERYEKNYSKIAGTKSFPEKNRELMRQVAQTLIVGWEGVVDGDKKPIPFNEENLKAFLAHPEAELYWFSAIRRYLNPLILGPSDELQPDELEADPDFLSEK
jgi:hypothetical protein